MFKNILIPISSEFYTKHVFETGLILAEHFKSHITLLYIIEEKTLERTDKMSNTYRTQYDKDQMKRMIVQEQRQTAEQIIFHDAQFYFQEKNITFKEEIRKGEYSTVITSALHKTPYDLILMGFEKGCLLNYRLLDHVDVPIWIESGNKQQSLLAICSNLAPNKKVPETSLKLSKALDWPLHMIYIVDLSDAIEVDAEGQRSTRKKESELLARGNQFVKEMKAKGIQINLVKGGLEKETVKAADRLNAGLVIIGREQKKRRAFGLSSKSSKKKIAESCQYSLLFLH